MDPTKIIDLLDLARDFTRSKEEEYYAAIDNGLRLVLDYHDMVDNVLKKDYSHVNLLDQVNLIDNYQMVNEVANSRILAQLFGVRRNGQYEVLQSFLKICFGDRFKEEVNKPQIYNEKHHIDILVQEVSYAIILENKIYKAEQQRNQLASYIRDMKAEGYQDEQIYVVYLPDDKDYDANDCSWTLHSNICDGCDGKNCKKKGSDDYLKPFFEKERYKCVDFRTKILPWLKDDVLPSCKEDEVLLKAALIQYIDFLEGLFYERLINNNIDMETDKLINDKLGLTGESCKDYDKVFAQVKDIKTLLEHLKKMLDKLNVDAMDNLYTHLKETYPNNVVSNDSGAKNWPTVSVQFTHRPSGLGMKIFVSIYSGDYNVYYGISPMKKEDKNTLRDNLRDAIQKVKGYKNGVDWAFYWVSTHTDVERNVDELINLLRRETGVE